MERGREGKYHRQFQKLLDLQGIISPKWWDYGERKHCGNLNLYNNCFVNGM